MKKRILFLASSVAFLVGCATTSSNVTREIRPIETKAKSEIAVIGMERVKALGPVFYREENECSEVNLLKYANAKYPDMDDVVNIRMEETRFTSNGRITKFQCKYYGLAVTYTSMEKDEADKWVDIRNKYVNPPKFVFPPKMDKLPPKSDESPAFVPYAVESTENAQ